LHGPTRFMLSMLAAIMAVDTLSRLVGMFMLPVVLSCFESKLISILPILPDFWSSRRSSSGPNNPSVCPKRAPITSGFSTTPSTSNRARITYFIVKVCADFVSIHLNHDFVPIKTETILFKLFSVYYTLRLGASILQSFKISRQTLNVFYIPPNQT